MIALRHRVRTLPMFNLQREVTHERKRKSVGELVFVQPKELSRRHGHHGGLTKIVYTAPDSSGTRGAGREFGRYEGGKDFPGRDHGLQHLRTARVERLSKRKNTRNNI